MPMWMRFLTCCFDGKAAEEYDGESVMQLDPSLFSEIGSSEAWVSLRRAYDDFAFAE